LASEDLLGRLTGADISPDVIGSDHCPVWTTLEEGPTRSDLTHPTDAVESRPQPPRLCARYLSHVAPTQSIRTLFSNIPDHIVIRSSEGSSKSPPGQSARKKRPIGSIQKAPTQKKQKTSSSDKTISKDLSSSQRSMNEFFNFPKAAAPGMPSTTSDAKVDVIPTDKEIAALIKQSAEPIPTRIETQGANQQWTSIFTKKSPPLCDAHGVPCIEFTTKKPGPNLGRRFWICSKPVGPGYDNGKSRLQFKIFTKILQDKSGKSTPNIGVTILSLTNLRYY